MAGHNKWSKVKHKKAATDARKSREFSKLTRLISLESKKSKGDTASPELKMAIEKAKRINMPKDVIERAVAKGARGDADALREVVYEAYGPGGAALIIEGTTDNKNRTGAEIKHLLKEHNVSLANPGSVLWAFEKVADGWGAETTIPLSEEETEKLDTLIEELEGHDDIQGIYTNAT